MNLRIAEEDIRFRITPADLEILLKGEEISKRVFVAGQSFIYGIVPATDGPMALDMAEGKFFLRVAKKKLEELHDLGRSKDGVSVVQGDIEIFLQIDIKSQARKAA